LPASACTAWAWASAASNRPVACAADASACAQRGGAGADRGGRLGPVTQPRRVATRRELRQPGARDHRLLDGSRVGAGERVEQGGEAGAVLVEAGARRAGEVGVEGVVDVGLAADRGAGGSPVGGVASESGAGAGPGVGGVGDADGRERGADRLGARRVPDLGDARALVVARCDGALVGDPLRGPRAGGGEGERGGRGDPELAAAGVAAERVDERGHRRVAGVSRLAEAAADELCDPAGDAGGARRLADDPAGVIGGRQLGGERRVAVEGVVERDAEAELIAGLAGELAAKCLGGHEERGAEHAAGRREVLAEHVAARAAGDRFAGGQHVARDRSLGVVGACLGLAGAGEAEVHDADAAVVADEHVAGLEVAVDHAGGVGGGESVAGGDERGDDLTPRSWRVAEPGAEGLAVDELHGEEHAMVDGADVVDRDDVGVGEPGEGLGLAEHAGLTAGVAGARQHDLEGDAAIELGVVGGVDHAHAAGAERIEQDVAAEHGALGEGGLRGSSPRAARRPAGDGRRRLRLGVGAELDGDRAGRGVSIGGRSRGHRTKIPRLPAARQARSISSVENASRELKAPRVVGHLALAESFRTKL
jgi:hypothetical protein